MAEKAEIKEKESEIKTKETGKINILKKNPWIATTTILVILVILLFVFLLRTPTGKITGNVISEEEAGDKIMEFVGLQIQDQDNASISSVEEVSGLYEVTILYNGKEIPLYLTTDGKLYAASVVPIDTIIQQIKASQGQAQQPQEVPKADKPVVELFVMSFCPYGNQAENTMLPVYNLLKNKVDWKVHYIVSVNGESVSSLHGQPEVDQDQREACVLTEYGIDKWWLFTTYINKNCGSDGACWENAAKEAKLDVNKIKTCVTNKGLGLMRADEEASNAAGASGSPTLLINGVQSSAVYQYGNSEAYKQAICSAFTTSPQECGQQIASSSSSSSSNSSGGSCG